MSCCSGDFKCPTAECLWAEVGRRYDEYNRSKTLDNWNNYLNAKKNYDKHEAI